MNATSRPIEVGGLLVDHLEVRELEEVEDGSVARRPEALLAADDDVRLSRRVLEQSVVIGVLDREG